MPPICRSLVRVLVTNAALGLIPAVVAALFAGLRWRAFGDWVVCGLVYSNLIGSVCWTLGPRAQRALSGRPLPVRAAGMMGVFGGAGVFGSLAGALLLRQLGFNATISFALRISLTISLSFGLLSFAIISLASRLEHARAEANQRRIAEESARKVAAEARYESLESRVQPHFLFNTLNSIAALVRENPSEAERMIERLSALLRYSLDSNANSLVPLSEELGVVGEYLEIERVRFGDRLRYRFDVDEGAAALRVPAFSIQTLAENSVKYAIGPRREGGEITVTARVASGALRVEVSDNGPGFNASDLKPGHGLDLLRNRLESLFGPAAALEIESANGLTRVAILAPS